MERDRLDELARKLGVDIAPFSDDECAEAIVTAAIRTGPGGTVRPEPISQDDIARAGARKINLIWEATQAVIAIVVIIGYAAIAGWCAVNMKEVPTSLSLLTGNIVGFYFSRTNHVGLGRKTDPGQSPYTAG
jgi:hypothetical protein